MPTAHSAHLTRQLKKPADRSGREFEAMCLLIYQQHFQAADAVYYGRGHTQHGIDIRMTTSKAERALRVIVQCKDVDRLTFSVFERDLIAALKVWAPKHEHDVDLLYIVATTANGVNTGDIDCKVLDLLNSEFADLPLGKLQVLVHEWDWLETVVRLHTSLSEHFLESQDGITEIKSHSLTRAGERIVTALAQNQLETAYKVWSDYLSEASDRLDKSSYSWVPIQICENLCNMFLSAGDFSRAARLFDSALGRREWSAKFRLGYLRAKRVVSVVPDDDVRSLFHRPVTFNIAQEVEDTANILTSALGTLDEQLTLALWVVTYATTLKTGSLGLTRALGLVNQAWPNGVVPLAQGEMYEIVNGLFIHKFADRRFPPPQFDGEQNQRAVILSYAYSYVRLLHSERFGFVETLDAEQMAGGWTLDIPEIFTSNLDYFFSHLRPTVKHSIEALLPEFYREGRNREFRWDQPEEYIADNIPKVSYLGANCTSDVLLADCASNRSEWRLNTFPLFTTHLALERLLQVVRLCEIAEDTIPASFKSPEHGLHQRRVALSKLIGLIIRREYGALLDSRRVYSFIAYYDCKPGDKLDELCLTLEFTRHTQRPFIATAAREYDNAIFKKDEKIQVLPYWVPEKEVIRRPLW